MTEENQFYKNVMTERVMKDKFYLDQTLMNIANVRRAVKNEITLYNEERFYFSFDNKEPNIVYKLST